MDDDSELLWRLYAENMTHVRHIEMQRSTTTSVLLTLSGGVLAVIGVQWKEGEKPHWTLACPLVLIGVVGLLFTAKLFELYREHKERARTFREALAARHPKAQIEELKQAADERWRSNVPFRIRLPVHVLWLWPHLLIVALGVLVLLLTASGSDGAGTADVGR